ncbi:hypothetical protein D7Y13_25810 [Corallococcus praedator]|uniref:DUF3592 domain-containing protein n=1 Tax=Corallococcus praedator TaxID=2316724 RepID=A0ABX9QD59_9BACT|nr:MULTISPECIES: hypothetical protein [Corallococcus]RKH16389.1 hypothetical protein D7X74_15605 [Corallococcus sp. CA047B]RKH34563.1 hypothetical protein D7X75_07655 [Corallococcus sp. CA031C]RKI01011.1 hypothetical protein D7Y13_25810 [Corallococcus praedator]
MAVILTFLVLSFIALFLIGMLFLFIRSSEGEEKTIDRVRREGQRYVAVIKEIQHMRGNPRNVAALLMKLETPSGPVGRRLIVPLGGAVTWDYINTARATERPVYVHCILDPIIHEAVFQRGLLLEEAPGGAAEP